MRHETKRNRRLIGAGFFFGLLLVTGGARIAQGQWGMSPAMRELLNPCPYLTYSRLEYMALWSKGIELPPLVTTSAAGTLVQDAGVLGEPGTRVVIGDDRISDRGQQGARLTFGRWLDGAKTLAVETQMWGVGIAQDQGFVPVGPIIARPFFNTENGGQDSQLVVYPGLLDGSLHLDARSEIYSVDLLARYNCLKGPCGGTIDLIGGYRYFRLRDSLEIHEWLGAIEFLDDFVTENDFHGVDMGAIFGIRRGPWLLDVTTKVALGNMREKLTIDGYTQLVGLPGSAIAGGLLAAPSNMGRYTDREFVAIPELDLRFVFARYERIQMSVGYNFAYVSRVVRTGDQIDLTVNPSQLASLPLARGGGVPSAAARPQAQLADTEMWLHGITFGCELRW